MLALLFTKLYTMVLGCILLYLLYRWIVLLIFCQEMHNCQILQNAFIRKIPARKINPFYKFQKKDGKQLLAIYIYIKEFDEIGAYFLNHLQVSESTSMLHSGAKLGYGNNPAHVTWIIQTYKVIWETEEYALKDEMLVPVVVPPLQPYLEGLYVARADELPTEVMLIQTPLNIYIIPQ